MKRTVLFVLLFTTVFTTLKSQEFNLGADFFNRYIWRGLDLGGKSPNIQPWAKFSFGNDNHQVSLITWSAFTFAPTANDEIDLTLTYSFKNMLNIFVTDYFFPGLNTGVKDKYFVWNQDSTGHLVEGTISFSGTEKIPFTALFAINFYGNDARKNNGELFFSKYAEIGFKKSFNSVDFNLFLGAALDKPATGETTYYLNSKPGIINIGLKLSKSILVTQDFALPIQCSFVTNPQLNKVFLTFGFSL